MRRQTTIWICRFTGSRFFDRESFMEHLLELRTTRNYKFKMNRIKADASAVASRLSSIAELQDWLGNSSYIRDLACLINPAAEVTCKDFVFSAIRVGEACNSHSAPAGKKTNWGGYDASIPRTYPGIECRINFRGDVKRGNFYGTCSVNSILSSIGIHTGTGGSDREPDTYQYSCTIWAQHFPALYRSLMLSAIAKDLGLCKEGEVVLEA